MIVSIIDDIILVIFSSFDNIKFLKRLIAQTLKSKKLRRLKNSKLTTHNQPKRNPNKTKQQSTKTEPIFFDFCSKILCLRNYQQKKHLPLPSSWLSVITYIINNMLWMITSINNNILLVISLISYYMW